MEQTLIINSIIDSVPRGLILLDKVFVIQEWNKWMETHSNIPRNKAVGQRLPKLFPGIESHHAFHNLTSALEHNHSLILTPSIHKYLIPMPTASYLGNEGPEQMRQMVQGSAINVDGVWRYVVFIEDATPKFISEVKLRCSLQDLKDKNKDLEQAVMETITANRLKSEFLANMSHEIRTPLNAIIGFADLLGKEVKSAKGREYLDVITAGGHSLLELINDILDLSKVEAGKLDLEYGVVDLREVVSEMAAIFLHRADEKNLSLVFDVQHNVTCCFILDQVRLKQVLSNLVSNAIKFTDEGGVHISASAVEKEDGWELTFEVRDSGIGIPKEEQELVFGVFNQCLHQDYNQYGGTGLGLAICKQLCELMNGEISVESEPGQGTRFRVVLRAVERASADKQNEVNFRHEYFFKNASVLIVDDVIYNRQLLEGYLEDSALTLHFAANGLEACEKVKSEKIDLILMDMKMPVMDGYEATRLIKQSEDTKNTPIIAVTASVLAKSEKEISTICDAYLRKPVSEGNLLECLAKYLKCEVSREVVEAKKEKTKVVLSVEAFVANTELRQILSDAQTGQSINEYTSLLAELQKLNSETKINGLAAWCAAFEEALNMYNTSELYKLTQDLSSKASQ
ncbi:MAG: response regulator [Lentisphaeraceae bacterium]|nr:response regulator [Lentisphaeraceae bacterium]